VGARGTSDRSRETSGALKLLDRCGGWASALAPATGESGEGINGKGAIDLTRERIEVDVARTIVLVRRRSH
jgi:hypothetical protein